MYFGYLKASMNFFRHNLHVIVHLNVLKLLISFVLKNISNCAWNCCFNTMNFVVTCFKIGFTISILKLSEFYLYSKYFGNQIISEDSRISGEFLWYIILRNFFFKLGQTSKNDRYYQNRQVLNNEIANWEQITWYLWLRSVSERSLAPFF